MRFTSDRSTLLDGLKTISGAVATKSTLPILMNIILETQNDRLRLLATDLEISIQTAVETTIEEEGSCTIPARKLRRLVNSLPSADTELVFEVEEDQARITIEETNSEFHMPVLDREEYPELPEVNEDVGFEVSNDRMEHLLQNSTFAAGTDSSRSYLCGVYFDLSEDTLNVVATDAHRLALHRAGDVETDGDGWSMLVPTKAASELSSILRDHEGEELRVYSDEKLVAFETGSTRLISRLIDEDYPDYHQVIPDDHEHRVPVARDRFLDAVKRVSLMADDNTRRLILRLEDSELTLEAESSETGGGEETVSVDYQGEPQTIAFNGDYLEDILSHVEDEEVYFDLISSDSPGTFRPLEDEDYLYIIMPLRLN